ncbi:carbohydrate ABC transporter permease [Ktedonosporobacter rubrisoli]|uniref:Carbohydrate ABC transporter permease n=1 Tax=Ktedonosporobacter rubrisoli TaxID=2509675 RepID=A0A4P6JJ43_KTERU|nr:carbohydrate ABC transporter permease [Ktedonosporobacter rubrisoli]QBD75109.1 carbohydrate ABC transporter permease [Ktedonosporobacter rubrisoli]
MATMTTQSHTHSVARHATHSRSFLRPGDVLSYLFLIVSVMVTIYPLAWMVVSSLKPGGEIATAPLSVNLQTLSLHNYTTLLSAVPLWVGFENTFIVLLIQGATTLFLCPLAGFAFAKFNFRGKRFFFIFVLATMMLPPVAMIIPLLFEMGTLNWVDTYQGLIAPGLVNAFAIFWTRQQISEVPDELLEAAKIDGCSPFGMYWRIILPVIRPALAALAIFTFLGIYNDFVWPVIIINSDSLQTLQVMLSNLALQINNAQPGLTGHDAWGEILAASTLATVPILILFIALQRQFIRGILAGSVKG